jgi:hypothetical protein
MRVLLGLVCLWSGLGLAESFAALTVIPTGQQQFDISTGVTTLPEGGRVLDKETGLALEAAFVRYSEGGFIEAAGSTVEGKFGTLTASSIYVDVANQTISASGSLQLNYRLLSLSAERLTIYLQPDIAVLSGNVQSLDPSFSVTKLLINLKTQQALLVSPYVYQNGPLSLQQTSEGQLLQLIPIEGSYNASTVISEDLQASLAPFLLP